MGITSTLALKDAPTSYTVTGGTAQTVTTNYSDGKKLELGITTDLVIKTRRSVTFERKPSQADPSAPNGMTQERHSVFSKQPKVLANTKLTNNTAKAVIAFDPEATTAERLWLMDSLIISLQDASVRAGVTNSAFQP